MAKDHIVELTIVVRLDRRIDEDLEGLMRDCLESEGLLEVQELTRVGLTGTIDLPRVWLPTATDDEMANIPIPTSPKRVARPKEPEPPKRRALSDIFKKKL